jgi:hypothetical protein
MNRIPTYVEPENTVKTTTASVGVFSAMFDAADRLVSCGTAPTLLDALELLGLDLEHAIALRSREAAGR